MTKVKRFSILGNFIGVILFVAVWQALIWVFDLRKFVLPSPLLVMTSAFSNRGLLARSVWPTLQEIVLGFGLSALVGIPLAIVLVTFKKFEKIISPILIFSQTIPKVAIAPLFVIWFGFGMTPKILIAFLISFFPVVIDTSVGLKSVPSDLKDLAVSTGANYLKCLKKVYIPYALPNIFGGLKLAITFATIGAIVGEFVGTSEGLGYVIQVANGRLQTDLVFAAVILLSFIGLLLFNLVAALERISIPWHESGN